MPRRKKDRDSHSATVGIRFTSEQRALLEEQANPIPLSTYLRNLILRRSRPKLIPSINLDCYRKIQDLTIALQQTNQVLGSISNRSRTMNPEQIQQYFLLLNEIKAELKQIGLSLIAANIEEALDEETDDEEFSL
ncbi:hypothetical protein [Leptolyngbya ohadii]|uniref:hypothetical protein n=1 Tax=Leptolyngbya ohadii TaxID=1962290 RepID=UPI000B59E344|nr:hypothetical protein [Leptolyngbya ohadii]